MQGATGATARDRVDRPTDVDRTDDGRPSGPHLRGSARERRRAVVDALHDGGGQLSLEALAHEVAEGLLPVGAEVSDERVQRVLLAHVLSPLLAEERIAFSPERRTVSLVGPRTSTGRTLLSGGVVSVALVSLAASTSDPTSPAFLGAVGLSVLSGLYLARRRTREWIERLSGPVPWFYASESDDSAGPATEADAAFAAADTEQRILALLLAGGGRLRQQTLIDRLGLSKSTVSRRVSSLAEAGFVTKVPVGRENLVCLPGARPVDGSPSGSAPSANRPDAGD